MYKAFCYGCKTHVAVLNKEEFTRSGHVASKDDAWSKYQINTNRLPRNVQIGR